MGQRTSPGASLLRASPVLPFTGWVNLVQFSSVSQFCLTLCDPMDCRDPMDTRRPCPLPTPGAYSNSCPLSRWCHPTILSSAIPFCSCLQSFPASGFFPMSPPFASGGQSVGASTSALILPMDIQDWFPLGSALSPCCPRDSRESSPALQFKSISSLALSLLCGPTITSVHDYW